MAAVSPSSRKLGEAATCQGFCKPQYNFSVDHYYIANMRVVQQLLCFLLACDECESSGQGGSLRALRPSTRCASHERGKVKHEHAVTEHSSQDRSDDSAASCFMVSPLITPLKDRFRLADGMS